MTDPDSWCPLCGQPTLLFGNTRRTQELMNELQQRYGVKRPTDVLRCALAEARTTLAEHAAQPQQSTPGGVHPASEFQAVQERVQTLEDTIAQVVYKLQNALQNTVHRPDNTVVIPLDAVRTTLVKEVQHTILALQHVLQLPTE